METVRELQVASMAVACSDIAAEIQDLYPLQANALRNVSRALEGLGRIDDDRACSRSLEGPSLLT